jgi:hypothetical protein
MVADAGRPGDIEVRRTCSEMCLVGVLTFSHRDHDGYEPFGASRTAPGATGDVRRTTLAHGVGNEFFRTRISHGGNPARTSGLV